MKAILLCAGMGSRLAPFTTNNHKAFLPINGEPLIERTLKYLHSKNITDITIVVGHHADQFDYLVNKFGVELRQSTLYKTHNNYTSMQLVLDKLEDCVVLEGDFYLVDDFVERIDTNKNQYFGQKITHGVEWGLIFDEYYRLSNIVPNTTKGWGLIGISYWKGDIVPDLTKELKKCPPNEYWDDAIIRLLNRHKIYANLVDKDVALEFDSIEDILFHNAMSCEDIAMWISETTPQKVTDNHYIITQNNKQSKIIINNNDIIWEDIE